VQRVSQYMNEKHGWTNVTAIEQERNENEIITNVTQGRKE